MVPQVTINFNELPITIVVKRRMHTVRKNVHMVFAIGPRSTLAEFPLSNSMEPLRGLEGASRPTPKTDKPINKKVVKNLNRNKRISDKHRSSLAHPG